MLYKDGNVRYVKETGFYIKSVSYTKQLAIFLTWKTYWPGSLTFSRFDFNLSIGQLLVEICLT